MNEIDSRTICDYFISCSEMQEIRRNESKLYTELQHKTRVYEYENRFINEGKEYLNKLLTIDSCISDISDKWIIIPINGPIVPYRYYGYSDYDGSPETSLYHSGVSCFFVFNSVEWKQKLLEFSINEYVSISGRITGIFHFDGNIKVGNSDSFSKDFSYGIQMPRFRVFLDLVSIEKKIRPKNKEGCFIATAVYEDYNAPEVLILRKYRDEILLKNVLGKQFVQAYYFISPSISRLINKSEFLKNVLKTPLISPFVKYVKKRYFFN